MDKPRMMFYHDGRHPLIYMYEPPMQVEEYRQAVDELLGTPIQALMFCMGDGRTVLHDTQVGELWGHNMDKWPHLIFRRAHQNAKHLIEQGHDPLRLVADRAHEYGMLFYPTLLVQQGSGERGSDTRGSNFRFDNKWLEIGAKGDLDPAWKGYHFADFKHEAIRNERFALIQETLQKYPVDGFELQLNYGPYYFHPQEVDEGRGIMTAWIKKVSEAVKASGAERELVVRIPASIEGCLSVGLDPVEWMRQGIVDCIVAQDFSGPELVNQMSDFRPMVEAAKGTKTRVHAAIQSNVDSDRISQGSIEYIRGAATNYWAQGVDGMYLAHWFGNWPYKSSFYEKLRELPYPEVMAAKDKIYYLVTPTSRHSQLDMEPGLDVQLTRDLEVGKPETFKLRISDDLPRWDAVGRVHKVLLRVRVMDVSEIDRLSFKLNGKALPDSSLRLINQMYRMAAPRYRVGSGYWFLYDLDSSEWPSQGENTLEITLDHRDDALAPTPHVRDVELEIQYLMGKHYHRRFVDAELGPYEFSTEMG